MNKMKTMIKSKFLVVALLSGLLFSACGSEDIVREPSPAQNPSSSNVYFSKDNNSNIVLGVTDTSFDIIIEREKADQPLTVPITVENPYPAGIFELPTSVTFAAGESSKTLTVPVKDIELMKQYRIALALPSDQTKPYTVQDVYPRLDLGVLKEDYAPYSEGTFTSAMFGASWPQLMEYSPSTKNYRLPDLIEVGYDYLFTVAEDGTITQVPKTKVASGYMHPSYGMISMQAQTGSVFDAATNTYLLKIQYTVSAGSFGVKNEKYVITKKL